MTRSPAFFSVYVMRTRHRGGAQLRSLSYKVSKWHAYDVSSKAAILIKADVPKLEGAPVPDPEATFEAHMNPEIMDDKGCPCSRSLSMMPSRRPGLAASIGIEWREGWRR